MQIGFKNSVPVKFLEKVLVNLVCLFSIKVVLQHQKQHIVEN